MNLLFIILAAFLILCVVIGFRRGFVRSLFFLASTVCAMIIAALLLSPLSGLVCRYTTIDDRIAGSVKEKIESILPEGMTADLTSQMTTLQQAEAIEKTPLPQMLRDKLVENNQTSVYEALGIANFVDYAAWYVAGIIVKVLTYLITFLLALLLGRLLIRTMDSVSELPLLRGINSLAGMVVGVFAWLLAVWIFFVVLTLFCTTDLGRSIYAMIEENRFLLALYHSNLLLPLLTSI